MNLIRILTLIASMAFCAAAHAQAWPSRPVRFIVPASAGAAPDNMIRLIAAKAALQLKQQVIVENRVGAGGIPAMQAFQNANDDHTFLLTITSTTAVAPLLFKAAQNFNYFRDVEPVMHLGKTPFMIVANPKSGATTLRDVLEMARSKPGAVAFATPPLSSIAQLSVDVLSHTAGVKFNLIPFSRSADSLTAVSSGDADFLVDAVSSVMPFVQAQRVRPIAVLSRTRLPGLEKYPLANETVAGYEIVAGFGLVGKKNLDRSIVQAMVTAVSAALADEALVLRLQDMAIFIKAGGPEAYLSTLRQETDFWGKVVRSAGVVAK